MSALRMFVLCLAMLATGAGEASDQVPMRVTLVLVDACTIQSREPAWPDALRVTCSSPQPYRIDNAPVVGTGAAATEDAAPVTTVVF